MVVERTAKKRKLKEGKKRGKTTITEAELRWFCRGYGQDYRERDGNDAAWLQCDCCKYFATCSKQLCCEVMNNHEEYTRLAQSVKMMGRRENSITMAQSGRKRWSKK